MADEKPGALDPATERALAVSLYNHAWTLLGQTSRTPAEDDELIHTAHASRFHWGRAGGSANLARGEWQCSRVYAALGRAEPSLHHARRCVELCLANADACDDWDLPAAREVLARALLVAGSLEAAAEQLELARGLAAAIADPEDRELIEADLDSLAAALAERS